MADGCSPVECGYCLRKEDSLEEPMMLPCGHVHCLPCLLGALEVNGRLTCPACKNVLSVNPKELPTVSAMGDKPQDLCDTCTKKGGKAVPAIRYCADKSCKKKYCHKHLEFHNELMGDHEIISLVEYNSRPAKHDDSHCLEHTCQPITMGCRRCKLPLCVECLENETACQGSAHHAIPLKSLFNEAKRDIRNVEKRANEKEDKLSSLYKKSEQVLCEFDTETEQLMRQIQVTRDEQLKALRDEYETLGTQLSNARQGTRKEILHFKEVLVETQLTELSNGVKKLVDGLTNGHEADVVRSYKKLSTQVQSLADSGDPCMTSSGPAVVLASNGTRRQAELKTKAGVSVQIGSTSKKPNSVHYDREPEVRRVVDVDPRDLYPVTPSRAMRVFGPIHKPKDHAHAGTSHIFLSLSRRKRNRTRQTPRWEQELATLKL